MKGTLILQILCISRSMGRRLANTLRCVWMTPLGSPVVPEVKTICTVSSSRRLATGLSKGSRGSYPVESSNAICWNGAIQCSNLLPTAGHKLRLTSPMTLLANSGAPRYPTEPELRRARRIPKKDAIHSLPFAPQITTRSPFVMSRASSPRA